MSIVRTAELRCAIKRRRSLGPRQSFLVKECRRLRFSPILVLHISAGIIGILSGTAAMSFRKGSPRHALDGKVFVVAMLTMDAAAVYLAVIKHQHNNIGGGILTFYLIGTA